MTDPQTGPIDPDGTTVNNSEYGPLWQDGESDVTYRIREDGREVAFFDVNGEEHILSLLEGDVQAVNDKLDG